MVPDPPCGDSRGPHQPIHRPTPDSEGLAATERDGCRSPVPRRTTPRSPAAEPPVLRIWMHVRAQTRTRSGSRTAPPDRVHGGVAARFRVGTPVRLRHDVSSPRRSRGCSSWASSHQASDFLTGIRAARVDSRRPSASWRARSSCCSSRSTYRSLLVTPRRTQTASSRRTALADPSSTSTCEAKASGSPAIVSSRSTRHLPVSPPTNATLNGNIAPSLPHAAMVGCPSLRKLLEWPAMHAKGILCAFIGHRWIPPADIHETYPLLECSRCGRRQEFAQGTQSAGYNARLEARSHVSRSRRP